MANLEKPRYMGDVRAERKKIEKQQRAKQNEKAKALLQEALAFYDKKHPDDKIGIILGKGLLSEELSKLDEIDLKNCRIAIHYHKNNGCVGYGPLERKQQYHLRQILHRKILKRIPAGFYFKQLEQLQEQKAIIEEKIEAITKKIQVKRAEAKALEAERKQKEAEEKEKAKAEKIRLEAEARAKAKAEAEALQAAKELENSKTAIEELAKGENAEIVENAKPVEKKSLEEKSTEELIDELLKS